MLSHALRRASPKGKTLTFITSATSTGTTTIAIPSSAAEGDLAVLFDVAKSATWPSLVTPSGWTSISSRSTFLQFYAFNLSYKVLSASDPGATITGMPGSEYAYKQMLIFRASPAGITATVENVGNQGTSGNPSAQTISAQTPYPYLVIGASAGTDYHSSWASAWYDTDFRLSSTHLAYKLFNDNGASVSVDCGDSGVYTYLTSCSIKVD